LSSPSLWNKIMLTVFIGKILRISSFASHFSNSLCAGTFYVNPSATATIISVNQQRVRIIQQYQFTWGYLIFVPQPRLAAVPFFKFWLLFWTTQRYYHYFDYSSYFHHIVSYKVSFTSIFCRILTIFYTGTNREHPKILRN